MLRGSARWAGALLLLATLLPLVAARAQVAAGGSDGYVAGELVVKLHLAADLPGVAAAHGLDPSPLGHFGSRPIYRLRISDGADPVQRAADLTADPRVAYAEPSFVGQSPESRQDYIWSDGGDAGVFQGQWAPAALHLARAHQITRGAGTIVAVLDTGVDLAHPALAGRLVPGYDFVDMDSDPSEVGTHGVDLGFGHGTHVAGLVALTAPDARIMPIRVLDRDGVGSVPVLVEAILYAVDHGAGVINLSLSTPRKSEVLREVIKAATCADGLDEPDPDDLPCRDARGHGAVVVAAAGNAGGTAPEYPAGAGDNGLLAIGASTEAGLLAAFSNRGSWVTLAAPGEHILSSVPGGGYGTWGGTSMATPLAAGSAALVRAACPALTAPAAARWIASTSPAMAGPVRRALDPAATLGAGCGEDGPTPSPIPSPPSGPAPPGFSDVPADHPFKAAIDNIAGRGIVRGYGDGRFGPDDHTLRAQMAAMIARAMAWDAEDRGNPFPDRCDANGCVDDDLWRNVGTLHAHDVARGYQDGSYGPFADVAQIQAISFITRAMVARGRWVQVALDDPGSFPNVPLTSGHRLDLLTYARYAGPLPGRPADQPWADWDAPATRGWFARALFQAIGDR